MTQTKTTKTMPTPGAESQRRAYIQQQEVLAARKLDVIAQMQEKYQTEPDRAYAEEVWGSLLRERGIEPKAP